MLYIETTMYENNSRRKGDTFWGKVTDPPVLLAFCASLIISAFGFGAVWNSSMARLSNVEEQQRVLASSVDKHTEKLTHIDLVLVRMATRLWPDEKWARDE